jgi:O-antigen ligase
MTNAVLTPWPQHGRRVPSKAKGAAAPSVPDGTELAFSLDPLRIVLFVSMVLNISRFHQAFAPLKAIRPGLLLFITACGYAFLNPRFLTRANVFATWPMRRIALLGILAVFSALFGISLGGTAAFILSNFSKTMIFAYLVALSIRHVNDLYTLIWAYAVSSGVLAYFSLIVFTLSKASISKTERLGELYSYDANDVCVVMLVGLALVLLLLQVAKGTKRMLLLMMLLFIGGTIARSGSRGGFVGLAVFAFASLFLINSISVVRKVGAIAMVVIGLAAFAPKGYWEQMETILTPSQDYNTTSPDGREALIRRGLGYVAQYPMFGIGMSNFSRAECSISGMRVGPGQGGIKCMAPHNSFLQAAAELGIPGLMVWASIVLGGIVAMLRLRSKLPRSWRRGNDIERLLYSATHFFALALVGFAAAGFFVSFAWLDILYILAALMTGLYISIDVYRQESAARASGVAVADAAPVITRHTPGWRVLSGAQRQAAKARGQA